MPVIHVQVGFRPGLPELSPRNKLFAVVKSSPTYQRLFEGAAGAISPNAADVRGVTSSVLFRSST